MRASTLWTAGRRKLVRILSEVNGGQDCEDWFSSHAEEFDAQYRDNHMFEQRLRTWRLELSRWGRSSNRVLDAGCGTGVITAVAATMFREVVAVDPSEAMLEVCKTRLASSRPVNWRLVRGAIESLTPDEVGYFDLVICSSVLEYVDDLPLCLGVLRDVLSHDGRLLVSLPNAASPVRVVERHAHRLVGRPRYLGLVRNFEARERYSELLREAGLHEIAVIPFGWHRPFDHFLSRVPFAARSLATMSLHVCSKSLGGPTATAEQGS